MRTREHLPPRLAQNPPRVNRETPRNRYAIRALAKQSAPGPRHASRMRRHGPARANLE